MKSLLPLLLLTISCASALTGKHETITVDSNPPAANATLFCGLTRVGDAVTPAKFTIARNAGDCTVTVSKSGFLDANTSIEQGVNPVYWANFLTVPIAVAIAWTSAPVLVVAGSGAPVWAIGGSGFLADYWSGAIHRHRPSRVSVSLRKESE